MSNLVPIERNSLRVLTTLQLSEAYGTDSKTISKNFERNRDKYQEGKHYFALTGDALKEFKGERQFDDTLKFVSVLYLWTEQGALHHAKSLGTDKAWEVFEMLEDNYFRVKNQMKLPSSYSEALRELAATVEEKEKLEEQNKLMAPKAEFFDVVAGSKDAIAIGEAAKVLNMGMGPYKLFQFLRDKKILKQDNIPYQEYIDRGYFRTIEQKYNTPKGEIKINIKTLVYQRGLDYIRKLIEKEKFN